MLTRVFAIDDMTDEGIVLGLGLLDLAVVLAAVVVVGLIARKLFGNKKKEDNQLKALQINPM